MKNKVACFLVAFFLLHVCHTFSQESGRCYTTEIYHELARNHPEVKDIRAKLEQQTRHLSRESLAAMNRGGGSVFVIPVVFHIVHHYGPENISDAQVYDAVRIMNEDFRLLNPDTASIVPAFKSIAADCEIEFRLAARDPNGNCTNGIDRIVSTLTEDGGENSKFNPWPENQYLNIWVVKSLAWDGVAAYAYYPGTAPFGADGVIAINNYVGSIGTSSPRNSRVLTHEIGHYFNLQHTWGDFVGDPGVTCGDDFVFDTPVTEGWSSCNLSGATCGNVLDNVQNYMEYTYCYKMFTQGQKTRMQDALVSSVGGRNNLWSPANLVATGTNGAGPSVCAPVADFVSDASSVCEGNSVQFRDLSWNGRPTTWSWTFPGGTPPTSSDSMPVIQYAAANMYDVTLVAGNGSGSNSITKTAFVKVGAVAAANTTPYAESFEIAGSFPGPDAHVVNEDGGNTWTRVSNAASTGTSSVMINNFSGNISGEVDDYVTGGFNLSGLYVPILTFKVAYAERDTGLDDQLTVSASDDCGTTWVTRYSKGGSALATVPTRRSNYFIPTSTEWRQESVFFPTMRNKPNVRFRFQNHSQEGNNVYIDDINISILPSGLEDLSFSGNKLDVYPNPSAGPSVVRVFNTGRNSAQLLLQDMAGRDLEKIFSGELSAGVHEFKFGETLSAGVYYVRLVDEDGIRIRRLVVTK